MIKKGLFIASVLGLTLLASCNEHGADGHASDSHAAEEHKEDGGHEGEGAHGSEIELSAEQAKAAGVVAEKVKPGTFHAVIPTSGSIRAASGDESAVVATISGVVRLTRPVTEGMRVGRGQTLFSISSERLQDGDPADRAFVAYEAAKKEYDRAKALVEDKIVTEKDFNTIRENYEMARIAYMAVAQGRRGGGVAVEAPREGYVTACLVKDGDYVAVGQPLLTTTRNRRMNLVADVPARYAGSLTDIKSAKFRPSFGGDVHDIGMLGGKLLAYGRTSAATSSFVPVTFEFDRAAGLMPGMSVEVWLLAGARDNIVTLPVAAITEEQGAKFVYVKVGDTHYEKREVATGGTDGERVEIKSGLKGGETVVTQGAIHVKLAAASNAIPVHSHSH